MVERGDMVYAWATDPEVRKRGTCSGAVTALLRFALEAGIVDAVLAIKKGKDICDAVPVLITNPGDVIGTAGSMHCCTLFLSKHVKKYLDENQEMKIAVPVRGCDLIGMQQLARRGQLNPDNVLMIGLNCGGTMNPQTAREMIREKYGVDPDTVVKEEISQGEFIIHTADGFRKGIPIDELEEEGYGRRCNCRRCTIKIPRDADLACGSWGVIGEMAGRATFIEIGTEKGADLMTRAVEAGAVEIGPAHDRGVEIRGRIEKVMIRHAEQWRKHQKEKPGERKKRQEQAVP